MAIVPTREPEIDHRFIMVCKIAEIINAAISDPEDIDVYTLAEKIADEAVDEFVVTQM